MNERQKDELEPRGMGAEVTLRLMTEADLGMLHEWLNRPHIVEWWGGEEARPSR